MTVDDCLSMVESRLGSVLFVVAASRDEMLAGRLLPHLTLRTCYTFTVSRFGLVVRR